MNGGGRGEICNIDYDVANCKSFETIEIYGKVSLAWAKLVMALFYENIN